MNGTDIAVAVINGGFALGVGYLAYQNRDIRSRTTELKNTADNNAKKLDLVERQTNGNLSERIREALRDELIRHSDNTEAIRDLLDGLLMGIQASSIEDEKQKEEKQ